MASTTTTTTHSKGVVRGAVAGLLSLGVFLGIAELVATLTGPISATTFAIGNAAVDFAPGWAKDFAIRTFGENDKIVLVGGIVVTLFLLAAVAGVISAVKSLRIGIALIAVLGLVGAFLAVRRPTEPLTSAFPSLVGAVFAIGALYLLLGRTSTVPADGQDGTAGPDPARGGTNRRRFLVTSAGVLALGASAGAIGRTLITKLFDASESRNAVALPAVGEAAPQVLPAAQAPEAAPFFTPNADFYRVDTALVVPEIRTEDWSLRIHGMTDRERTFTFAQLLAMPSVERDITLTCVSNLVGGPYVGNARWQGVLLSDVLPELGIDPKADQLLSSSIDGYSAGTPLADVLDGRPAILAYAMNGEPLPFEHGFPVRLIVPGIYGYASATKWLVDLEVTTFAEKQAYWVPRGYAERAPIKLSSKIQSPLPLARVDAGKVLISGSAWAQTVGISKVEVSVDKGPWMEATLADEASPSTWRQFSVEWQATPGPHTLVVRATDARGKLQLEERTAPLPNGSTGWQSLVVTVA